ncbi:zinc transporter foi isoform X2 [Agrilus planipennis]|uniref:Zinc transporter foi isoform X2 n=1 Tax=Agrilus planipennis TaxID=224129 RepID=A0A7F5RKP9_AGRPL|nr:zinc transporter foi isoform X2 [Agrilus planipennis]
MASHILSVCMFCLLCATHSPCESHASLDQELLPNNSRIFSKNLLRTANSTSPDLFETKSRIDDHIPNASTSPRINTKTKYNKSLRKKHTRSTSNTNAFEIPSNENSSNFNKIENDNTNKLDKQYLKKIFEKYGNGETMTLEGFEKLMKHLSPKFPGLSDNSHVEDLEKTDVTPKNSTQTQCLDQKQLYSSILSTDSNKTTITDDNLMNVCPVILYTMVFGTCTSQHDGHTVADDSLIKKSYFSVWLYSNVAVIVVSVCGVIGLAVIPIMQKKYYQSLLQFLVALAVGTLAGDALLHLLPHAMSATSDHHDPDHDHHDHTINMWKGLVAMMGLILFFVTEKVIIFGAKWRKKSQLKKKIPKMKVMRSNDLGPPTSGNERQCKHKYSSIPYCYDTITMMDASQCHDSVESHNDTATTTFNDVDSECEIQSFKKSNSNNSNKIEFNQNMTECPGKMNGYSCTDGNKMLESQNSKDSNSVEEYTVILREHENKHHGHSHTHGHVHAAPQNLSSVAWMVIMGDGLHNFTDGMAIGAAFTGGIADAGANYRG